MRRLLPLLLVGVLGMAACAEPIPADASGAEVYQAACAACHGADLGGQAQIPGLGPDSPSAGQPREYFVDTVTLGRMRMPSFASTLTADQIEAVVDFILEKQGR